MKRLSQRELLQEDFHDLVRGAGRVFKSIYAPVFEPIKPLIEGWDSPEKALRGYVKSTPNIRITKIVSTKPNKTGSSGGRIGISPPTAGLTKGHYGTNIYQIFFEAEIYNPETGLFEQAYTPSSGGILMPSFTKNTTPSSSTPPASTSPAEETPAEETPAEETPAEKAPKVYRADIERINGKYRVVGIYDEEGKPVSLNSKTREKTPEGFIQDIFDGSTDDYKIKFKKLIGVKKAPKGTDVRFEGYVEASGKFNSKSPTQEFIATVSSSNNNLIKLRDATGKDFVFTT
jgi:hypothetical protein